jgi:hypothetical protein
MIFLRVPGQLTERWLHSRLTIKPCYGSLLFGEEPHSMVLLKGARSPTGEVEGGPKLG